VRFATSEVVEKVDAPAVVDAEEKEEEVIVNPLKEEAYHALACLMKKRGFRPDFLRATFGPHLLNKTSRLDGDIHEAVKLWCSDPAAAVQKYGHTSKWDVSRVTSMSELFRNKEGFNADISA